MGINVSIFIMLAMIVGPFVLRFLMRPNYQNEPVIDNTTSSDISMPEECGSNIELEQMPDSSCQSSDTNYTDLTTVDFVEGDVMEVVDDFHFDLRNAIIAQTILQNDYTQSN